MNQFDSMISAMGQFEAVCFAMSMALPLHNPFASTPWEPNWLTCADCHREELVSDKATFERIEADLNYRCPRCHSAKLYWQRKSDRK
jgi:DNA-directed RNA polymerase subunit RPC12/RpoP